MSDYFEVIDSEEKAYYLGLLFAVGSLTPNRFILKLATKYFPLIKTLSLRIHGKNKVKIKNNYISLILPQKIGNQLILLGRRQDSSLNEFPDLCDDLVFHFMRGHYDGTGSFTLETIRNNRINGKINIRMPDIFKAKYLDYLIKYRLKSNNKDRFLSISGNVRAIKFLNKLYDNANIYADWNFEKFSKLKKNSEIFNPNLYGPIDLTMEETIEIGKKYQNGETTVALGKSIGSSYNYIRKILKNQNIDVRDPEECGRKIKINKYYFDSIDSEDKAYYLGLFFADGCNHIGTKGNQIALSLHKKDIDILEKFSKLIYDKSNIKTFRNQKICIIYSKHMSDSLTSHGCTPRKSLTLQFPQTIPDHLMNHFLRGYFDGDGCIYLGKSRSGKMQATVTIVSTIWFCQKYKEILSNVGIKSRIHHDKRDIKNGNWVTAVLHVNGNDQVNSFHNYLYRGGSYYLSRKKNKFLKLSELYS